MKETYLHHYKKTRKQLARMCSLWAFICLLYALGLHYWHSAPQSNLPPDLYTYGLYGFIAAAFISLFVALWNIANPATYEVIITKDRFIVRYPFSDQWSFDVKISDIKRFEYRNTLSHAGRGIMETGILMKDGSFQEISKNYLGLKFNVDTMYKATKLINPDITFSKKINKKVEGSLGKDYDT